MNNILKRINAVATMLLFCLLAFSLALSPKAHAAKNCSIDNSTGLTPLYQQTIVDSGSISPGDVLMALGESNTNQIFNQVRHSSVVLHNAAVGGCAIGNLARNASKCWANIRSDSDVVWLKPVNRARDITGPAYAAALESDTRATLTLIKSKLPNVKEVWISPHHGTPWSAPNGRGVPPKQGEPYSWWSGPVVQNVVNNPPANLGFNVVIGPYLWANGTTPRGDGLVWRCDDFNDDGVHLGAGTNKGNDKAANEIERYIDNALGNDPGPPPPTNNQICHCRFPDTYDYRDPCTPVAPQTQCRLEDE